MISVIMPVFNNLKYISSSVNSILNQTYKDFEFIILDDCSTEPICDIIHSFKDSRIKIIRNDENIGLTKSLNICLKNINGDIIARQDSDDISLPTRFEKQIKKINNGYDMVSCWGRTVDSFYPKNKKFLKDNYLDCLIRNIDDYKKHLMEENCILGPAAMFKKEVFDKIGYYDEDLYFAQDYNYWIRISKYFKIGVVSEDLYLRRRHSNSVRNNDRHKNKKNNLLFKVKNRANKFTIIK